MADLSKNLKNIWMKGMEAIGNTASSIASNTKYKVDEMNLLNRRREILSDFGSKAYALWQKGECDLFPDELKKDLEELSKLDNQLVDMRAEHFSGEETAENRKNKTEKLTGSEETETEEEIPENAEAETDAEAEPDSDEAKEAQEAGEETEAEEANPEEEAGEETDAADQPEEAGPSEDTEDDIPVISVEKTLDEMTDRANAISDAINELFDKVPSVDDMAEKMNDALDQMGQNLKKFSDGIDSGIQELSDQLEGSPEEKEE